MRVIFVFLIIIHGLIHLLGFVKAFNMAQVEQLTQSISKPAGIFWLLTSILFIAAAVLYFLQSDSWWVIGAAAVIISQVLILLSWSDAKFGTVANIIILVSIIIAYANNRPTSYRNIFKAEVAKGLQRFSAPELLGEADIEHLPSPVKKYIINSGAIGREKLQNFRAVWQGKFRTSPESEFRDFHAVQYNFFDEPARVFHMQLKMYGIPFVGLHLYKGPTATMRIKMASLLQIVDAHGPEMNQGETVTMFNDMCCFAPAALIDKNITWEEKDSLTVNARFTNLGNTIAATLFFNDTGELIDFSSHDRYESADGKIYKNYRWSTPVKNYREIDGRRVPTHGEAIWHKPEGEYCYGKFDLVEIEYNCREYK